MRALIFAEDPLVRDQLLAGASACPDLELVCAFGRRALNLLTRREDDPSSEWDWIYLQVEGGATPTLLRSIRERNREAPIVIVGEEKEWRPLANTKEQWLISGFLNLPLDPTEFFRTLGRLRKRATAGQRS